MKNTVNLDKALADIRQWPGARTDRKVFKIIAEYANDEGASTITETQIAGIIGTPRPAVVTSANRLALHGLISLEREDTPDYYMVTYTIAPAYLLHTDGDTKSKDAHGNVDIAASVQRVTIAYINAADAVIDAYAKQCDKLAEQLEQAAANIRKITGSNYKDRK